MLTKQALRSQIKAELKRVSPPNRVAASRAIAQHLEEIFANRPGWHAIGAFWPLTSEPDTSAFLEQIVQTTTVFLPIIDGNQLAFGKFEHRETLRKKTLGVYEPTFVSEHVCFDAILVPGLAVDQQGFRLGRSGGFYDRWLNAHPQVIRVGVCFAQQFLPTIPREPHDAQLDLLVTEHGVTTFDRLDKKMSRDHRA